MMKRYLDKRFITFRSLELYVVNELQEHVTEQAKQLTRAFPDDNSGVIMASTGARGSTLNIGQ